MRLSWGYDNFLCFRFRCHYRIFYILPVIFLTTIWNIPRFLELRSCYKLNNTEISFCNVDVELNCDLTICATELRQNLTYCHYYFVWGNFIIMVFIPLLILSIFNGRIYHVLTHSSRRSLSLRSRQSRPKRDQGVATILITIVIVFACCNIPRVSINVFEVREDVKNNLVRVTHSLCI